jgi:hypothetical protein
VSRASITVWQDTRVTENAWPKHFARTGESVPVQVSPTVVERVIDVFRAGRSEPRDWVVGLDVNEHPVLLDPSQRAELAPALQAEVSGHELLFAPRTLAVPRFFVMFVEKVEPGADLRGENDPMALHGELAGPFPSTSPQRVPGVLTTTRVELLDALVRSGPFAFHHALEEGGIRQPRTFPLHLAADGARELANAGFVIAYLREAGGRIGNERTLRAMLYEVLSELREQVREQSPKHPLVRAELPVPDRAAHVFRLEGEGYTIEGEVAKRKRRGALLAERRKLPPEGTVDDYLALANASLAVVPGWPSARASALKSMVHAAQLSWTLDGSQGLELVVEGGEPVVLAEGAFMREAHKRPLRLRATMTLARTAGVEAALEFHSGGDIISIEYRTGERTKARLDAVSVPAGDGVVSVVVPLPGLFGPESALPLLAIKVESGNMTWLRRVVVRPSAVVMDTPPAMKLEPEKKKKRR